MVTTDYIGKSALNNSFGALQKKKNNRFQKVMITDFFHFWVNRPFTKLFSNWPGMIHLAITVLNVCMSTRL